MVPVFPELETVETDVIGITDMVAFVWIMLEVDTLFVSFGDDGP